MSKKKKNNRIIRRIVGAVVVILLAAYFVFALFSYYNKKTVNFYEVEEGSLVKEHHISGLILRSEKPQESAASGYVSFYVPDQRKVSRGQKVYLIDSNGKLSEYLTANTDRMNNLNKYKLQQIKDNIRKASVTFDPVNFRESYDFKDSMEAMVLEYTDIDSLNSMMQELKARGISFSDFAAPETGIVSYDLDGYESVTPDEITSSLFDKNTYSKKRLKSGDLVEQGEPVYKLITDEKWYIAFEESEELKNELSDKNFLKISLTEKDITLSASYTTIASVDGKVYGLLTLDRYVIQYLADRFIDFEIITNDVSGLKIPDKSIVRKDFYVIPEEFKQTDDLGNAGFYKTTVTENGNSSKFIICDIYMTENGECYVDLNEQTDLKPGDVVSDPADPNGRSYAVNQKKPMEGVYNINKGYAVFKRIEKLESANGYTIVKRNTGHGLTVYDHIVLDAAQVTEGQVLYK